MTVCDKVTRGWGDKEQDGSSPCHLVTPSPCLSLVQFVVMKILHVVGTRPMEYVIFQLRLYRGGLFHRARPNFMKAAPIMREMEDGGGKMERGGGKGERMVETLCTGDQIV